MSVQKSESVIAITSDYVPADDGDTVFGKRWASQLVKLDTEHLSALDEGKYLALDVQGEYIVYLQKGKAEINV